MAISSCPLTNRALAPGEKSELSDVMAAVVKRKLDGPEYARAIAEVNVIVPQKLPKYETTALSELKTYVPALVQRVYV